MLEVVARIPYFSFISILHLYESIGFWRAGAELRRIHFAEEWNEMHHLQVRDGSRSRLVQTLDTHQSCEARSVVAALALKSCVAPTHGWMSSLARAGASCFQDRWKLLFDHFLFIHACLLFFMGGCDFECGLSVSHYHMPSGVRYIGHALKGNVSV